MKLVVSDTGPVNYLTLIGQIELLPRIFQKVFVPAAMMQELLHPNAPDAVRGLIQLAPEWLEVREPLAGGRMDPSLQSLDPGEQAAIQLASELDAHLLLMDDRAGASAALRLGFAVTGTIGLLHLGATRGFVDLRDAFTRLRQTSFRCPDAVMEALLNRFEAQGH